MRKLVVILLASLCPAGGLFAQNVTKDFLQKNGGHWAFLKIEAQSDSYRVTAEGAKDNAIVERVDGKYYLISGADSIFVDGPSSYKIDLPGDSGVVLHNREEGSYRKPTTQTSMTIPRPLVLKDPRPSWSVNLANSAGDKILENITVLRDWPSVPPKITFIFKREHNPFLQEDSLLTVPCDSSVHYSSHQILTLSQIRIEKDPDARFVKLKSVSIDGTPFKLDFYKGTEKYDEDAFSSPYCALTSEIGKMLNAINGIQVEYSYLDDNLKEAPVQSMHTVKPSKDRKPTDVKLILSCILFGLMLSAALLLLVVSFAKRKDVPVKVDGPKTVSKAGDDNIEQKINSLKMTIEGVFGPKPAEETYSMFLARRGGDLRKLEKAVKEVFGPPNPGESTRTLLIRSTNHLKEEIEQEKRGSVRKLDEQRKHLDDEHTTAINEILEKLQFATASQQVDLKFYRSSQLSLLREMRSCYESCCRYISSGTGFGDYAKRMGLSLMSFTETAEAVYKHAEEKDDTSVLAGQMSPVIRKALDDHTSWLNALARLEAYARTEVLRKQMLRDGIGLASLSGLFYAAKEFLSNNHYVLNPLPDLFVDTDNLEDYDCDNMDIVISNIFDYEEFVQDNAVVDIIKAGYSYKNELSTKTTIAYYSKPIV